MSYRNYGDPTRARIFNYIENGVTTSKPVRVNGIKDYVPIEEEVDALIEELQSNRTDSVAAMRSINNFLRSSSRGADMRVANLVEEGYQLAPQEDRRSKGRVGRPRLNRDNDTANDSE